MYIRSKYMHESDISKCVSYKQGVIYTFTKGHSAMSVIVGK